MYFIYQGIDWAIFQNCAIFFAIRLGMGERVAVHSPCVRWQSTNTSIKRSRYRDGFSCKCRMSWLASYADKFHHSNNREAYPLAISIDKSFLRQSENGVITFVTSRLSWRPWSVAATSCINLVVETDIHGSRKKKRSLSTSTSTANPTT